MSAGRDATIAELEEDRRALAADELFWYSKAEAQKAEKVEEMIAAEKERASYHTTLQWYREELAAAKHGNEVPSQCGPAAIGVQPHGLSYYDDGRGVGQYSGAAGSRDAQGAPLRGLQPRDHLHPGDLRFPGWIPPPNMNAADRRPARPPDRHPHQHFPGHRSPEGEREPGRFGEYGANPGTGGRRSPDLGGSNDEGHSHKIREADKVDVPPFPDITQIAPWRTKLMNSVAVASGNSDYYRVTLWLAETWSGKNLEELADSGGTTFVMLDLKLASAMTTMMHKGGERSKRFRDRVNLKMEEASKMGDIIKGRQIVWMLLDSFKTFDRSAVVYGFDHLSTLRVNNK